MYLILKIYFLLFCFFTFGSIDSFSQNLVLNPSFEDTIYCPTTAGDFLAVNNWMNLRLSPDYYHACATGNSSPSMGVPSNWAGYQDAKEGNAYVGIGVYITASQREFIGIPLSEPLMVGTKYFFSAYISRQDTSNGTVGYACSSNRFGFRFISFTPSNPMPVDNFSHYCETAIIEDTLVWRKISGSFIADSSYNYLVIGNFYDDINTNTSGCFSGLHAAYYYVDMVCVSTDSALCNTLFAVENVNIDPQIFIYPNPVESYLVVEFSEVEENTYIIIHDACGKKIKAELLGDEKSIIDISMLPPGVFFAQIFYRNHSLNYKLIKQ